ncbi:hypothetical protein BLNAU_9585 [Blattamonas nauphoetae]|uniref:Uncharacterized protein n=1 Tax=Blattamonas nauphoetae TaxID=2049346 RepID=A0ABQ9XVN3_9EUKA|nr:hypothetical protein BLNAU_9585 [Blattamonas nauphoetae]
MSGNASTASTDPRDSLLEHENMTTLRSFVASKCGAGEEVEWKDLMEWFVCAVIGLDSKASQCDGSFSFDWDDVVVDGFGTVRINLSSSHSDSSPPHSPPSFTDGLIHLSRLFLNLIDQLSKSNCLTKRIEPYLRKNLSLLVICYFVFYLVSTGHVVPACDTSKLVELSDGLVNHSDWASRQELDLLSPQFRTFSQLLEPAVVQLSQQLDSDLFKEATRISLWKDFLQNVADGKSFKFLHHLGIDFQKDTSFLKFPLFETDGLMNRSDAAINQKVDLLSPQSQTFSQLLDHEVVETNKQLDSDLFQEATGISSWKDFLRQLTGEKRDELLYLSGIDFQKDTSFLKFVFFRPTLLSLQAKFQQLASSLDGSAGSSTSSQHSSHSSPHTSLDAHLDSSNQTHSSSPHFKQESLQLLNILHSLLTSPLPPSPIKVSTLDRSYLKINQLQQDTIDPDEKFHSSLFDEVDNEKLARSLVRCLSVRKVVGAEKCIRDIPNFMDRLFIRRVVYQTPAASFVGSTPLCLPRWPTRRAILLCSGFDATEFDWDGLAHATFRDVDTFVYSTVTIFHPLYSTRRCVDFMRSVDEECISI